MLPWSLCLCTDLVPLGGCRVDAASQAAALNALANLQSIAAAQGAVTLGQAPPTLLPSRPMDLAALQRHQVGRVSSLPRSRSAQAVLSRTSCLSFPIPCVSVMQEPSYQRCFFPSPAPSCFTLTGSQVPSGQAVKPDKQICVLSRLGLELWVASPLVWFLLVRCSKCWVGTGLPHLRQMQFPHSRSCTHHLAIVRSRPQSRSILSQLFKQGDACRTNTGMVMTCECGAAAARSSSWLLPCRIWQAPDHPRLLLLNLMPLMTICCSFTICSLCLIPMLYHC